jgi:hypothetical protein
MSISLVNRSGFLILFFGITLIALVYFDPFIVALITLPYVPDPRTF